MSRLLLSAAHKSSGKTTVSIGLCAALRSRGLRVQPFKKGPDYIDPMWLSQAAARPCYNLDFYIQSQEEILATFTSHASHADLALVEGNKGLYDGLDLDGSNSNAALAKLLALPVVLVLDTRGVIRGVAPLLLGYQAFDPAVNIAGVILNNVGGSRHEAKLRAVVEHYTDIPVLGAVHHDTEMQILERHLGLVPANEAEAAQAQIQAIGQRIAKQVDLDRLLAVAAAAPPLVAPTTPRASLKTGETVRVAIARDRAFGFYYADDLDALRAAGAELLPFDALHDPCLPEADALFIGGGFPESFAGELAANRSLRQDIRRAIEAGLPTYAECGGLMYLARSLTSQGTTHEMVGIIPGDVVMHAKPVGRGYVRLKPTQAWPWLAPGEEMGSIQAHEFHYSSLENLPPGLTYAYAVQRGHGIDGRYDGFVYKNLLASYTHLRGTAAFDWPVRFLEWVRRCHIHHQPRRASAG
ncbi:cobyrinate a,c-diamide synthase [Thiobacter aerophilum]|uniref:Cobyrinate a,c-diamide synthase n=1 Tax=Thiobacter aerophilum TaxID=3121275 RepID=A0ABV0EJC0_9BURK